MYSARVLATSLACVAACSSPAPPAAPHGERIVTPLVTIGPGEEKFFCYATRLAATEQTGVKRWSSTMTPGSHHLIVFAAEESAAEEGALWECNGMTALAPGGRPSVWAYGTQEPEGELRMPEGVGVVMAPRQLLVVNMHYLNPSSRPLAIQVEIDLETYAPEETYVPAAAFATFQTKIDIPPHGSQTVEGTCDVPPGAQFFALTTHSHRYTKSAIVSEGGKTLVETTNWEHPTMRDFREPFLELASGKLTYRCAYENPTDKRITTGESASDHEMCMAVGYFFPTTKSAFCINDTTLPLGGS